MSAAKPDLGRIDTSKRSAGSYVLTCPHGAKWKVMKDPDNGVWNLARFEPGEDEATETSTTDRLKDAKAYAADACEGHHGDLPEEGEEGEEPEPEPEPADGNEPEAEEEGEPEGEARTVAWAIPNNPNSKLHRTVDGKVTACGLNIPGGKELDAKPRGECGHCF